MIENNKSDSLLDVFIFELNQMTEQLESILLECEESQSLSAENINEIFRIMHTIKGSAAMMAKTNISTVAHCLEDLFAYIREEKPAVDVSAVSDLVFKVLDYIRLKTVDIVNRVDTEGMTQEDETFLAEVRQQVAKIRAGTQPPDTSGAKTPEGQNAYKATVFFDDDADMLSVRAFMVVNRLTELCSDVRHVPQELAEEEAVTDVLFHNGLEVYFTSELDYYGVKDFIEETPDVKTAVIQQLDTQDQAPKAAPQRAAHEAPGRNAETEGAVKAVNAAKQSLISVNLSKLDQLVDLVGEMVISESMVIKNPDLHGLELENFSKCARHLQKLTSELQDLVLSIRMVPMDMVFSKMHRIVRDMSKKLGKEVTLKISGGDTEVDKNIIDHLSDPLMHLIRNCMDHGIEPKEERVARGKDPMGTITLEARNTGSEVVIAVSDDGGGLNKEKILEKARKNGLLPENANPTDKEICNLILLPGFSTKDEVSEFSGRGVGMDVVKQNIELVRGSVFVDSAEGKGTIFTIKIPLTLAIIKGMLVKVGRNTYIIPIQSIVQSFRPEKNSVFTDVSGREMVLIRGECYYVVRLHQLYGVKTETTEYQDGIIILTESNGKKLCLFVDMLLAEQDVVVKSLPRYLSQFGLGHIGIGGCTILGDGSISPILEIAEIANYIEKR